MCSPATWISTFSGIEISLTRVVISKPKSGVFSNVLIHQKSFDPSGSNSDLWDVKAIFIREGSQL